MHKASLYYLEKNATHTVGDFVDPAKWQKTEASLKYRVTNTTFYKDELERHWCVFFSIKPYRANIKKAVRALESVTELEEMRGVTLALPLESHGFHYYWDASCRTPDNVATAETQSIGRELKIPVEYDSGYKSYQFQAKEYKQIILRIWSALEKAGVDLNYCMPLADAYELAAQDDILTPVSHGSYQEVKGRHGRLLIQEPNPNGFVSPLSSVMINGGDLYEYDIQGGNHNIVLAKRLAFHCEHLMRAKDNIIEDIHSCSKPSQTLTDDASLLLDELSEILNQALDDQAFLEACARCFAIDKNDHLSQIQQQVLVFENLLPGNSRSHLLPFFKSGLVLKFLIEKPNAKQLRVLLTQVVNAARDEITQMQEEFLQPAIEGFLREARISVEQVQQAILARPSDFQNIYRRLIHIQHEALVYEKALSKVRKGEYAGALEKIWHKTTGSVNDKAIAVLRNYTLKGSQWLCFLLGHWNRSKVYELDHMILALTKELTEAEVKHPLPVLLVELSYFAEAHHCPELAERLLFILSRL